MPKLRCTEILALKPEAVSQIKAEADDLQSALKTSEALQPKTAGLKAKTRELKTRTRELKTPELKPKAELKPGTSELKPAPRQSQSFGDPELMQWRI